MTLEQQLKKYLDGKFFYLTHEGRVECREVDFKHSPFAGFEKSYSKESAAKGGKATSAKKRNHVNWSEGQTAWLKKNMNSKTVKQCADALNVQYHRVYAKISALRWLEHKAAP